MTKNRPSRLEMAIQSIDKQYGKATVIHRDVEMPPVRVYPTGLLTLDSALHCGGIPRGKVCELWGKESSGKTTLALLAIARCQQAGGTAAFIDAEHALDRDWAEKSGVSMEDLLLIQPRNGEMGLDCALKLAETGEVDLIVVDSVAQLTPEAVLKGEITDDTVGALARLMSKGVSKLVPACDVSGCTVLFINQVRDRIGGGGKGQTTTGGHCLRHMGSVRIKVWPAMNGAVKIKNGNEEVQIGQRMGFQVVKNKCGMPHKKGELTIRFDRGLSFEDDLIACGLAQGIVELRGSWYSYDGQQLGQGLHKTVEALGDDRELASRIYRDVRVAMREAGLLPDIDGQGYSQWKKQSDDEIGATSSTDEETADDSESKAAGD